MAQTFLELLMLAVLVAVVASTEINKYTPESFYCRLLKAKYTESQPWVEYPLIYEPIVRGRLIVWSGVSTLPGSEFECLPSGTNGTTSVSLNIAKFSDKFEWTLFDMNRGITYHGISVNSRQNMNYEVGIINRHSSSYLDCNTISSIKMIQNSDIDNGQLKTMCRECGQANVALVDNLISELIKTQFNNEIVENMNWHLTQLIGSRRFSSPLKL